MPPLLEFVVPGVPVSGQGGRINKRKWRNAVREAASAAWSGRSLIAKRLRSTLINFHKGNEPPLDNDNLSKPLHDALINLVYSNDRWLIQTQVIQVDIDSPITIQGATGLLLENIRKGEDFLYVRLDEPFDTLVLSG
jgi:hypothetical protein